MEALQMEAVYEHGTLKLAQELPLADGQRVTITIHPPGGAVQRLANIMHWNGTQADLDFLILAEENDPLEAP